MTTPPGWPPSRSSTLTDEPPWASPAIRARINARLAELNKTASQLPQAYKKPWTGRNGPTTRILAEIATALNWTLPDVLGFHEPHQMKPDNDSERSNTQNYLRSWREAANLTQTQVEKKLGWQQSRVSHLERRNAPISIKVLRALAPIYGCQPFELLRQPPFHSVPHMKPSTPDLDPLLEGLMKRLPPPGAPWPDDHRKLWLQTLENCLQLLYPETGETKNERDEAGG